MGTLSLTGRSEIKVHQETTVVTIIIEGMTDDYKKSLKENTERAKELKDIITSNGISKEAIKSLDFWVREDWTSWWDEEKKKYKKKFNGFKYHQKLNFKFLNDNIVLSKITYEASKLEKEPCIDVKFITERTKEYEAQLLKEAMEDALSKAKTLSEAGGFELAGIEDVTIDEGYRDNGDVLYAAKICSDNEESFDLDFEPEDYVLKKKVDVCWNIR